MAEIFRRRSDESESSSESEEEIQTVSVDVTKLTPLSPEVISKQVRSYALFSVITIRLNETTGRQR